MNLGVIDFQGKNRAVSGVIIGPWVMKGAQEVGSGTKGHQEDW